MFNILMLVLSFMFLGVPKTFALLFLIMIFNLDFLGIIVATVLLLILF